MKKTLVVISVLLLAVVANANLVLSFNGDIEVEEVTVVPSTIFVIDVHQLVAEPDEFWIGITGLVDYAGFGILFSPAPSTMVVDDGGYGFGWIHAYMTPDPSFGDIGKWWEVELHCIGEGDVIVELYDASGYEIIDTMIIHQVPEPMTMALLGLGGLFLRRRK